MHFTLEFRFVGKMQIEKKRWILKSIHYKKKTTKHNTKLNELFRYGLMCCTELCFRMNFIESDIICIKL